MFRDRFLPHLTLDYLDEGQEEPSWEHTGTVIVFPTLRLAIGDAVHDYPFTGALKQANGTTHTAAAFHAALKHDLEQGTPSTTPTPATTETLRTATDLLAERLEQGATDAEILTLLDPYLATDTAKALITQARQWRRGAK